MIIEGDTATLVFQRILHHAPELVWDAIAKPEGPVPEMPLGENAIFRYELAPEDSSTLLTVTYRRITKQTASGFLPGLHAFLDRLEAQLDEKPLPDWSARFAELLGQYPEWTKHAAE